MLITRKVDIAVRLINFMQFGGSVKEFCFEENEPYPFVQLVTRRLTRGGIFHRSRQLRLDRARFETMTLYDLFIVLKVPIRSTGVKRRNKLRTLESKITSMLKQIKVSELLEVK